MSDHERRKMNMRDYLYILVALGGLAWVGKVFVLANDVEKGTKRLDVIEPRVSTVETQVAVVNSQISEIRDGIKDISRQLRRRGSRDSD